MNSECLRIADQLRRAFTDDAWHGPSLHDLLTGITAEEAGARAGTSSHTISELAFHIAFWTDAALQATRSIPMPDPAGEGRDWLEPRDGWLTTSTRLFIAGEQLARAIEGFTDDRLLDVVPGREYDFYYLFHGIVQHSLYHAGQIALLKKAGVR